MNPLLEVTLALLAAVGLLCMGWYLQGKLFTPMGDQGASLYLVVRGEGEGTGLEYTVNTLIWLRGREVTHCPILLVDMGLNEEGRMVAGLLLDRWPELRLCKPEELVNYVN